MPAGLVIFRDEQLRQMRAVLFGEFQAHLLVHLRKIFPLRTGSLGEEGTLKLCLHGLERAEALGFSTERNLTLWVDLYFALGPRWESAPGMRWLLDLAEDRSRSEDARVFVIYRRLPSRCANSGDAKEPLPGL